MDNEFAERYSRHFPLSSIGKEGQLKLKNKRVLIAGVGGLGTVSSELLASLGVGFLRLADYDVIELSNLPRQKLYSDEDIGKAKVEVAEERLRKRNPNIEIDVQPTRVDALSAKSLLSDIDLIIDGLDKFSTRKALFRAARKAGIPYAFTGSVAEQANIMIFTHEKGKPCLQCVVGDIGDDPDQSCEVRGVHPSILQIATSIQVAEAIKLLIGKESELEDKMMFIDLQSLEFEKFKFKPKEDCKICGTNKEDVDELDQGEPGEITKGMRNIGEYGKALVTSLCGRDTKIIDPSWDITWDFSNVRKVVANNWHISVKGDNYITFNIEGVGISLLKSGVATIRGAKTTQRAIDTFQKFLDILSLPK